MVPHGRSSMTSERVRFTYRIEKFSLRASKGSFASPQFRSPDASSWCLFLDLDEDHVVVRLNKSDDDVGEDRLVRAKLWLVDFSGSPCLTEEREIYFTQCTDAREVFSVAKSCLYRYRGLNSRRFLPDDTLTIACELVVCRENLQPFLDRWGNGNSDETAANLAEYFARSSLVSRNFQFGWTFEDFSVLSCKGRLVTDAYRELEGSEWKLVLTSCNNDHVDVNLRRNDPALGGRGQFVEVKLTVLGRLGSLMCPRGEKQAFFRGYVDEEVRVLSISKDYFSGWLGLKKLLMMPGDSLTFHCDVTVYDEQVDTFRDEQEFVRSFGDQGSCLITSSLSVYLLLSLISAVGIIGIFYFAFNVVVLPFYYDYVVPFATDTAVFVIAVYGIYLFFFWIKDTGENLAKAKQWQKNRGRKNSNNFYEKQKNVPYKKKERYHQNENNCHRNYYKNY